MLGDGNYIFWTGSGDGVILGVSLIKLSLLSGSLAVSLTSRLYTAATTSS